MLRAALRLSCFSAILISPAMQSVSAQQVRPAPPISEPQLPSAGKTMPLLSLDNLHFLEGTWSATTRDGRASLGTYTFARELNGTVLARRSMADAGCDPSTQAVCARRDLFYVFQDSPGAPPRAISFDNEGHTLHFLVSQAAQGATSTTGRRDFVLFDTDPAQLGPRLRLRYEHDIDTVTGKDSMSAAFEVLQQDGTFLPIQQWYGVRQQQSLTARP